MTKWRISKLAFQLFRPINVLWQPKPTTHIQMRFDQLFIIDFLICLLLACWSPQRMQTTDLYVHITVTFVQSSRVQDHHQFAFLDFFISDTTHLANFNSLHSPSLPDLMYSSLSSLCIQSNRRFRQPNDVWCLFITSVLMLMAIWPHISHNCSSNLWGGPSKWRIASYLDMNCAVSFVFLLKQSQPVRQYFPSLKGV